MSRQTIVLFLAGAIGLICLTLAGCSDDSTSAVALIPAVRIMP